MHGLERLGMIGKVLPNQEAFTLFNLPCLSLKKKKITPIYLLLPTNYITVLPTNIF